MALILFHMAFVGIVPTEVLEFLCSVENHFLRVQLLLISKWIFTVTRRFSDIFVGLLYFV